MSIVRHLRCVYSTTLHLLPHPNIQSILIFMNLIRKQVISMYFSYHYFQIWAWISISGNKRMPRSLPEVQKGENNSCVHGPALACTQTFYFSFVHHERRAWENERRARERKNLFCSSSTTTPLYWRSIHPPRFTFYHTRSTDFEEKKDGLSTG